MIQRTYSIEFLTPCFCAGADQSKAEIRAPSIRGELRWWFRVLGGSIADESDVFGSVRANDQGASRFSLRVRQIKDGNVWQDRGQQPPEYSAMSNKGYLTYFAKASGAPRGQKKGPRWQAGGYVKPGSQYEIILTAKRELPDVFDRAFNAFLEFGALGLRSTRGLGAFFQPDNYRVNDVAGALQNIKRTVPGFEFYITDIGVNPQGVEGIMDACGDYLRGLRSHFSAGKSGNNPSPLGTSSPRQASAVRLRPYKRTDGKIGLLLYEAPAAKILSTRCRIGAPILALPVQPKSEIE